MSEYIDKIAVCYQLDKQASRDGQPRAIRRAKRIVEDFPVSNVRSVVFCEVCNHWDKENQRIDKCGGSPTACCRWFTRQGNYIETSAHDFCSYGNKGRY